MWHSIIKHIWLLKISTSKHGFKQTPKANAVRGGFSMPILFQIHLTRVTKPPKRGHIPEILFSPCVELVFWYLFRVAVHISPVLVSIITFIIGYSLKIMLIRENIKLSSIEQTKLLSSIYFYLLCIYGPSLPFS